MIDTDGDGMPDDWEIKYGLDPTVNDADEDYDEDGFSNIEEYLANTDPTDPKDPGRKTSFLVIFLFILGIALFIAGIIYLYYSGYDQIDTVYLFIGAGIILALSFILFLVGLKKTSLVFLYLSISAEAYLVYAQYMKLPKLPAKRPALLKPISPMPPVLPRRPPVQIARKMPPQQEIIRKRREEKYKEREKLFEAFEQKPVSKKPETTAEETIKTTREQKEFKPKPEVQERPKEDVFAKLLEISKAKKRKAKKKKRVRRRRR